MKKHLEVHGIYSDTFSLEDEKAIVMLSTLTKSQNLAFMMAKKMPWKCLTKTDIGGQLNQHKEKRTVLRYENEYVKLFLSGSLPFGLTENPHLHSILELLHVPTILLQNHKGTIVSAPLYMASRVEQKKLSRKS